MIFLFVFAFLLLLLALLLFTPARAVVSVKFRSTISVATIRIALLFGLIRIKLIYFAEYEHITDITLYRVKSDGAQVMLNTGKKKSDTQKRISQLLIKDYKRWLSPQEVLLSGRIALRDNVKSCMLCGAINTIFPTALSILFKHSNPHTSSSVTAGGNLPRVILNLTCIFSLPTSNIILILLKPNAAEKVKRKIGGHSNAYN